MATEKTVKAARDLIDALAERKKSTVSDIIKAFTRKGIGWQTLWNLYHGRPMTHRRHAERVGKVLGLSAAQLMGFE